MQKADYLLRFMKQQTDAIAATDEKLQQFLMWVSEKSLSVELPYKPAAVRAFYFAVAIARNIAVTLDLDLSGDRDLARALNLHIDHTDNFDIIVDLNLGRILARAHALTHTLDDAFASNLDFDFYRPFAYILNLKLDLEFKQALQQLKTQLPDPFDVTSYLKDARAQELPLLKTQLPDLYDDEIFKQWWQANGQAWLMQLREVMISYRNIGHDWHFSYQQMKGLRQYYDANKLLVDCLNRAAHVTPAVREEIEETLLLPIAEIERKGSC
jgi:hypothetical protein